MDPSVPKKEILNPLSESSQPSELTQPSEPYHEFKESKEKKLPKIIPLSAILFIFLLIIASFFATAWALAYEKVKLEKYPDFQKRISHFVQSLPLTPKTPKFLIEKTITAQQNAAKHSFDVSLAFDSDSLISSLGLAKLDLEAKGAADYSDPKNLIFDLNASISKDFKLDLKKKDAIIFFKITKFPTLLLSLAGIKEEELSPITDKWVSYDTSGLNTLARKEVDKRKEMKSLNDYLKETQEKYLDEFVLERMKTEKVREDTGTFYKISLNQSDEVLNHIGEKLIKEAEKSYQEQYKLPLPSQGAIKIKASDYIKNFKLEVFIDSNNFHTRKILLSADFKNLSPIISNIYSEEEVFGRSDNKVIKMALVAKFDDFGKDVVIQKPAASMNLEEFINQLSGMPIAGGLLGISPSDQLKSSRDTQRRQDLARLQTLLDIYFAECKKFPQGLDKDASGKAGCTGLVPAYLANIPKDPKDQSNYYYKSDGKTYDLCAKLEVSNLPSTCPNPAYNYKVGSKSP